MKPAKARAQAVVEGRKAVAVRHSKQAEAVAHRQEARSSQVSQVPVQRTGIRNSRKTAIVSIRKRQPLQWAVPMAS